MGTVKTFGTNYRQLGTLPTARDVLASVTLAVKSFTADSFVFVHC